MSELLNKEELNQNTPDEVKTEESLEKELKDLEENADKISPEEFEERKKKIISVISALRKEAGRVIEKKEKNLTEEGQNFFEEFRRKNIAKATELLKKEFSDLSSDENKLSRVLETFEKISDKSAFDTDEIFSDLKKAYAVVNADDLLEKAKRLDEISVAGEQKKIESGSNPHSGSPSGDKSYPPEVIELANKLGKKPEEVQEYLNKTPMSGGWTY